MTDANEMAYPDPRRSAEQTYSMQDPWNQPTGFTKRELFAAMAMQGILANNIIVNPEDRQKMISTSNVAKSAVHYADALITALNDKP